MPRESQIPTPIPPALRSMRPSNDPGSGIHEAIPAERKLSVVVDFPHITPELIQDIRRSIDKVVGEIEGEPVANENGQLALWPGMLEEQTVREGIAEEVRQKLEEKYSIQNVGFTVSRDKFKIGIGNEEYDPRAELGFYGTA